MRMASQGQKQPIYTPTQGCSLANVKDRTFALKESHCLKCSSTFLIHSQGMALNITHANGEVNWLIADEDGGMDFIFDGFAICSESMHCL
jgi:hypothetical protein